ncbi:MAG: relaxase/mobilization nuclease domain-containing protein [Bacteroidota bacterium]|nr:relaxase/mobilization nuclease domain-containing protein [Bacteroidota bacterium]
MISKVVIGNGFYGACRYVCMDQKRAVVLDTQGVRNYNYKLMADDFETQQQFRPSLSKAVFHGILSFYPGEKIADESMIEIARKYLAELKINNTQYAITKHTDKDHQHLHILANLVNNKGETIKDSWIGLRGKKAAQKLTLQYNLKIAQGKNLDKTHLENLNEKEASRYIIYQEILQTLPHCKNLDELKQKLQKQSIETLYKYKGQTTELQGISFKIGEYKFKGSEIDRKFSIMNLEKQIQQNNIQQKSASQSITFLDNKISLKEKLAPAKELHREKSLLDELMKPEKTFEQVPYELIKKQNKKRRGLGLH